MLLNATATGFNREEKRADIFRGVVSESRAATTQMSLSKEDVQALLCGIRDSQCSERDRLYALDLLVRRNHFGDLANMPEAFLLDSSNRVYDPTQTASSQTTVPQNASGSQSLLT
jgi:hypothetical protein